MDVFNMAENPEMILKKSKRPTKNSNTHTWLPSEPKKFEVAEKPWLPTCIEIQDAVSQALGLESCINVRKILEIETKEEDFERQALQKKRRRTWGLMGAEFSYTEVFQHLDNEKRGFIVARDMGIALRLFGATEVEVQRICARQGQQRVKFQRFCQILHSVKLGISANLLRQQRDALARKLEQEPGFRVPQVFLGGACNPTTWRQALAIPFLQDHQISFYNPQVDEWEPELIQKEEAAKQTAKLLLYVIGRETRAVASMIEASELISSNRLVVLVLQDVSTGKFPGPAEAKDLNRGRAYLADVAARHGVPFYKSVEDALLEVPRLLRSSSRASSRRNSAASLNSHHSL